MPVRSFLDTSVLIAAFYANHQFHEPSLDLLLKFPKSENSSSAHCLAETYASVTGRSGRDRVNGEQAMLYLGDLHERLTFVHLDEAEYLETLAKSAELQLAGGAIYDALIARCALKAGAESIFTWNPKDFFRLGSAVAERIRTPDSI